MREDVKEKQKKNNTKEGERARYTDKRILFEIQAWIEPAVPIHLAYSIDTKALS